MIEALIELVMLASRLLSLLLLVRVVLSWVNAGQSNPIVGFVHRLTEPLLAPVRNLLPATGGLDFSPLLVLVAVQVVERVLVGVLIRLA